MEEKKHDTDKPELNLKEFLEFIVKAIVNKPEEVKASRLFFLDGTPEKPFEL